MELGLSAEQLKELEREFSKIQEQNRRLGAVEIVQDYLAAMAEEDLSDIVEAVGQDLSYYFPDLGPKSRKDDICEAVEYLIDTETPILAAKEALSKRGLNLGLGVSATEVKHTTTTLRDGEQSGDWHHEEPEYYAFPCLVLRCRVKGSDGKKRKKEIYFPWYNIEIAGEDDE